MVAVFQYGFDRALAADLIAVAFCVGIAAAMAAPYWDPPSVQLARAARHWLWFSAFIHLTWELPWLLLYRQLPHARDAAWAYPWYAYIDGGDTRYLHPDSMLLAMELLSVLNALAIVVGLCIEHSAPRRCAMILTFVSAIHLYSATLYFASEVLNGLPSVDTSSFIALWIKFIGANSPWLIMPWVVLRWSQTILVPAATATKPHEE